MQNNYQKFVKKFNSYKYDHFWFNCLLEYGIAFLMSVVSAAVFAFGVTCFIKPTSSTYTFVDLISGGSSGLAQVIALIFKNVGIEIKDNPNLIYSICYITINIPLSLLAFFGVGKRFGIFTFINVGSVFLFTNIFKGAIFEEIAIFIDSSGGGLITRALFAGLCTGLSSAIAFKYETSAGGFDVVSYYISLRKSTTTGKYGVIINASIIIAYSLISALSHNSIDINTGTQIYTISSWAMSISTIFFSIIYLFTAMLVIDAINVRNKKVQIQIITSNHDLPRILLSSIPHGATILKGEGAFSGQERLVIYMVVSSLEVKQVIHLVRQIDKQSFVNVTSLQQVYGRFFAKPVK